MEKIGIKKLSAYISKVMKEVEDGKNEYIITKRNIPIAKLIPLKKKIKKGGKIL